MLAFKLNCTYWSALDARVVHSLPSSLCSSYVELRSDGQLTVGHPNNGAHVCNENHASLAHQVEELLDLTKADE